MAVIGERPGHKVTAASSPGPSGQWATTIRCTCGYYPLAFADRDEAIEDGLEHLRSVDDGEPEDAPGA